MPYQAHFGLKEKPFHHHPDPRFFYLTDQHQTAMQKNQFVADNRLGLGVTYGSPGTGKTTLSRIIFQRYSDSSDYETVLLANPAYKTDNRFLRAVIQEFDVGETQKAMSDSLSIFGRFLEQKVAKEGKTCLLLIDHGERMKEELFSIVDNLLELRGKDSKGLLQVLVFGRNEVRDKLRDPRSGKIYDKVAMTSSLEAMTYEDLVKQIHFRFHVAGLDDHPFTDEALKELYIVSRGNPRAAVRLADAAMHEALNDNRLEVHADTVKQAEKALNMSHDMLILQNDEKPSSPKKGKRGRPPKVRE
jgi:general secretion pathway protein A